LNPRPHEAQLQDQKPNKAREGHLEEGKTAKPTNGTKSSKPKKKAKKSSTLKLPLKQPPPNTLNASSPP
jgi:hypothetical protein